MSHRGSACFPWVLVVPLSVQLFYFCCQYIKLTVRFVGGFLVFYSFRFLTWD